MKYKTEAVHNSDELFIKLEVGTVKINPVEVQEDLELFKKYLVLKYAEKNVLKSFKEWIGN